MTTKKDILDSLNDEQRVAVENYIGPSALVAGPGSGKTYTLVKRTQYMILNGVDPSNILLFTFTNKAAREIKERIALNIGEDLSRNITMGTYHSFCCRILRQYAERIGFTKTFSIYDSADSDKVIAEVSNARSIDVKLLKAYISGMKKQLITPSEATQGAKSTDISVAYAEYQTILKSRNSMDFDDLIMQTVLMLRQNKDIRDMLNSKYRYISADEFHDSSLSDIELIRLLSGEERNVCYILDDNQSIYAFRGANIKGVLSYFKSISDLKYFYLNHNYRSTKTIVDASLSLIDKNKDKLEKNIFTNNSVGDKLLFIEEENQLGEAIKIGKMIQVLNKKYGVSYKDIALLYRTNNQSRVPEEAFLKMNIPYQILSGTNFYAREEIKDLVSYLKFLTNPYDKSCFTRIVNVPRRGIGDKTLEIIDNHVTNSLDQIDYYTACNQIIEEGLVKGAALKGLQSFVDSMDKLYEDSVSKELPETIKNLIKDIKYYAYLEAKAKEKADEKMLNITELIEISYTYPSVEEFMEDVSLLNKNDDEEDEIDKVNLLTMHMSKGLEFRVVFVIGCSEGTSPSFRAVGSPDAMEEERRLFYVAMTRAKEQLYLTRSKKISQNGSQRTVSKSRFISEIDKDFFYN